MIYNDNVANFPIKISPVIGVKQGPVRLMTQDATDSQSLIHSKAACATYNYTHTLRWLHRDHMTYNFT